jgi:hypothetical protein
MQQLKGQAQRQLTLELKRKETEPLVAPGAEATLLQALAALLLGALGKEMEERESRGGVDERENHN